jgi:hypothetical protein
MTRGSFLLPQLYGRGPTPDGSPDDVQDSAIAGSGLVGNHIQGPINGGYIHFASLGSTDISSSYLKHLARENVSTAYSGINKTQKRRPM